MLKHVIPDQRSYFLSKLAELGKVREEADYKKQEEADYKKKMEMRIEGLKSKYLLFEHKETFIDNNIGNLQRHYRNTPVFRAGEYSVNILKNMRYKMSEIQIAGEQKKQDIVQNNSIVSLKK